MTEGTHVPTLPTDEDLRVLARQQTPAHLDGFWEGLEASLREGRVSPLRRASRRRAWLMPAAAAAAVAVVIGGTSAVRTVVDGRGGTDMPAAPATEAAPTPGLGPLGLSSWEDLEPWRQYLALEFGPLDRPTDFALPDALVPGDRLSTAFWIDDAGRHVVITSNEAAVRDQPSGGKRVVTTAAHVTLATYGESGWAVVNRVTERPAPDCLTSSVQMIREQPGAVMFTPDGVEYSERITVIDRDGDGFAEEVIPIVSTCERNGVADVAVRVVAIDGPDTFELGAVLGPDLRAERTLVGPEVTAPAPLPAPQVVPESAEWDQSLLLRALQAYEFEAALVGYGDALQTGP